MRKLLFAIILFSVPVFGQENHPASISHTYVRYVTGAPSTCTENTLIVDRVTGIGYVRVSGACQVLVSSGVPTTRTINTTSPITGGGDLSADRTIACATCGVTGTGLGQFASTTSAQLATVLSDETGTGGGFVRATSPVLTTPNIGAATTASQITSTVATGTAPFVVSSTTPVANLTAVPTTYTNAGAQVGVAHITIGTVTLSGGTGTITFTGSSAFTANSSYAIAGANLSNANAFKFNRDSGSQVTVTGTGTDTITFIAVGN